MRQLLYYIFIFFVSILFTQCSSARKGSIVAQKAGLITAHREDVSVKGDVVITDTTLLNKTLPETTKHFSDSLIATLPADTLNPAIATDTTKNVALKDSIPADTTLITIKKDILEIPVYYTAKDSMVFTKENMGFLYGDAEVKYGKIGIKGEYITMDMDSSVISSTFGVDSVGKEFGYPVFDEDGTTYEMKKVRYNFKTDKAFINHVVTKQGEGFIVAKESKKNPDNSFYMRDAKYTTCDLHEHPHFYLNLSKAKVRPEKDIVTGPVWLVVADVPLFPIVLPFAFFPFTKTYSSGIIMPSYGDEMNRGFYLNNGGYYFAINDYVDLAVTGEIYTKGTWGIGARSNYRKRYKFSGSFNAYYLNTAIGDRRLKDIPGAYSVSKDFRLNWTHSQDPKANMYRTLSASVNFSTSKANLNDLSTLYTPRSANNTKSSSVNLTQRFPNSPWSLSATMNINQVSRDSTISATLPNVSITMSRINPFKRKKAVGEERWYEKITMSYSGEFRNSIFTKEDRFFKSNIIRDWTNGMRHNIPVSATFTLFNYIQISPSINYNERWYTSRIKEAWNPVQKRSEVVDTIYGFNRVYDYNASLSFNTKLYGFYKPWKIFGDKVQAIRHVFSPSVSLNYTPGFSAPRYNFYERYTYKDEYGKDMEYVYSPYSRMMFGTAPMIENGGIGFEFKNNVEMKIRSDNDSTGYKKKSLIDDLGIRFNYNMKADSMKWSPINTDIRLKLSDSYTLNLSGTWDPYIYKLDGNGNPVHVDKLRILNGKGFGRLINTSTSFSYSFNQDTFKKWFGKDDEKKTGGKKDGDGKKSSEDDENSKVSQNNENRRTGASDSDGHDAAEEYDTDGFLKSGVQWNLSFNYSVRYGWNMSKFDTRKMEYKGMLTHNFGLNGSFQPTKNWNFTFNTDYNFDLKRFTNINCSITRNLHCWSMSASFIPIGPYKSYNFVIRANASLLQDLKWEQRNSPNNNMNWY